ncbi:MFS transporter [Aestuariicella hydrocarbonica]|uniref:MFS transporter n=1 Tax=Pseudomaricurvus hydrocarbonicus TaxID=1470433 RepID=A0A9E5MN15_9GAMM|nr:MFS transporter [Aestuariicella hydrocarbonica]NHO67269.1 MFS transporter [Aestuariicella hydrocarbonica]
MLIAFVVVLLDMIGFGMMVPILAFYALRLGAGPELATFCMALYVIGMFFSTPLLGRLSDYYGRKPVLMISMAGSVIGYVILGFADTVWMIALSRLVSGLMAGNVAAAQAYVTDISTPENRAKGMGLIGAALGLGFIIGPLLGSFLAGDSFETANLQLPAMVAAGLSFVALLMVLLVMKESLSAESRTALQQEKRVSQWQAFYQVVQHPVILLLVCGGLTYNVAAGLGESIFPIWTEAVEVAKGPRDLMPMLLTAGIAMVIVQAGLIGPLTRRFGETRLLLSGAVLFTLAMLGMTFAGRMASVVGVMGALAVQSVGAAMILTSMQSLVSQCATPTNRGTVLGVYSSIGTLGRAIGTSATGAVFANLGVQSPYYFSATSTLLLVVLALFVIGRWQSYKLNAEPVSQAI